MVEAAPAKKKLLVEKFNFKHLQTPAVPTSPNAHLVISLNEPSRTYRAGQKIQGFVKTVIYGRFDAKSLTLRFQGFNRASYLPTKEST